MRLLLPFIFLCALGLLCGCVSADFKVVDALRTGMTEAEAQSAIASFGFQRNEHLIRPPNGWPAERGDFTALAWRAGMIETQKNQIVAIAEYYPVHHGFVGAGQLFLFYDANGKLLEFYRYQIN
jgi:hypothetical protein